MTTIQATAIQAITATPATNLIDISLLPETLRNQVLSYHNQQEKINNFRLIHDRIKAKSHFVYKCKINRNDDGVCNSITGSYHHSGNIFLYLEATWNCYRFYHYQDKPRQYYLCQLLKNIYNLPEWKGRNGTNFRMFIRMIHSLEAHTHYDINKNLVYDEYDGYETYQKQISRASYERLNRLDGAVAQIVLLIQ